MNWSVLNTAFVEMLEPITRFSVRVLCLGLGIYDSDSNDDSDPGEDEPANGVDSDEELRVSYVVNKTNC